MDTETSKKRMPEPDAAEAEEANKKPKRDEDEETELTQTEQDAEDEVHSNDGWYEEDERRIVAARMLADAVIEAVKNLDLSSEDVSDEPVHPAIAAYTSRILSIPASSKLVFEGAIAEIKDLLLKATKLPKPVLFRIYLRSLVSNTKTAVNDISRRVDISRLFSCMERCNDIADEFTKADKLPDAPLGDDEEVSEKDRAKILVLAKVAGLLNTLCTYSDNARSAEWTESRNERKRRVESSDDEAWSFTDEDCVNHARTVYLMAAEKLFRVIGSA